MCLQDVCTPQPHTKTAESATMPKLFAPEWPLSPVWSWNHSTQGVKSFCDYLAPRWPLQHNPQGKLKWSEMWFTNDGNYPELIANVEIKTNFHENICNSSKQCGIMVKNTSIEPQIFEVHFLKMMAVYSVCPIRCLREYTPRKDTDEDGGKVDTW